MNYKWAHHDWWVDKEDFLLEHGHNFFHNADFVDVETYKNLFRGFDLNGKTIVEKRSMDSEESTCETISSYE